MARATCIAAVIATFACATPYQPHGMSGGYSETQLGENVFRVSFEGNGYTSAVRTADFALLRSAEVALAHGYDYFIVTGDASAAITSGGSHKGTGMVTSQPSTITTILCFKERPEGTAVVYEAKVVRAAMRGRYELDEVERRQNAPPRTTPVDPYASQDR